MKLAQFKNAYLHLKVTKSTKTGRNGRKVLIIKKRGIRGKEHVSRPKLT